MPIFHHEQKVSFFFYYFQPEFVVERLWHFQLEETKRELQRAEAESEASGGGHGLVPASDFISPAINEKIVRLERENESLKAQLGGSG